MGEPTDEGYRPDQSTAELSREAASVVFMEFIRRLRVQLPENGNLRAIDANSLTMRDERNAHECGTFILRALEAVSVEKSQLDTTHLAVLRSEIESFAGTLDEVTAIGERRAFDGFLRNQLTPVVGGLAEIEEVLVKPEFLDDSLSAVREELETLKAVWSSLE